MANLEVLPDILGHGMKLVFCGINPGMQAAACGHHFLGRGNRFWPVLHLAGFTPYQLAPQQDKTVLRFGIGLTTAVARPTQRAAQLQQDEFVHSAAVLQRKLNLYQPECIAFLGKAAWLGISGKRDVGWGEQLERLGSVRVWILPNPSGLNRAYSKEQLVLAYAELNRSLLPRR